jgi:hypothetical protein
VIDRIDVIDDRDSGDGGADDDPHPANLLERILADSEKQTQK